MAKAYKYTRNIPARFTLNDRKDYALFKGGTYELPADNEYIRSLEAQGYLVAVDLPKRKKKSDTNLNS